MVWHTPAGESVPLVNTINELLNMVNFVLRGLSIVDAQTNTVKIYTKGFVVSFIQVSLKAVRGFHHCVISAVRSTPHCVS